MYGTSVSDRNGEMELIQRVIVSNRGVIVDPTILSTLSGPLLC